LSTDISSAKSRSKLPKQGRHVIFLLASPPVYTSVSVRIFVTHIHASLAFSTITLPLRYSFRNSAIVASPAGLLSRPNSDEESSTPAVNTAVEESSPPTAAPTLEDHQNTGIGDSVATLDSVDEMSYADAAKKGPAQSDEEV